MPKKRRHLKYSKPQSTAPASFATVHRVPGSDSTAQRDRSVNELLSRLRRTSLTAQSASQAASLVQQVTAPSVPPLIRQILQLPETEPPAPRRPSRRDPTTGRRLPAGPPPPRSWLSLSRRAASLSRLQPLATGLHRYGLPGARLPSRGSLTDLVLRRMVDTWDFQRSYNHYYLSELPSHLRVALIAYLAFYGTGGVSLEDLQIILVPPLDLDDVDVPSASAANEDVVYLDLTGSVGRSIKLRELSAFLFPATDSDPSTVLKESWDAVDEPVLPRPLLPNLTHLSLALDPRLALSASWRHLLAFSAHLPTLTHLSLAFWPEPCLTPNAKFAAVVSPQGRTVQYGGTGPYSHSLDHDWAEAVAVLRRLAKNLYGLEFLDLTGCAAWFSALAETAGPDAVDWVGDWGKIEALRLRFGYEVGAGDGREPAQLRERAAEAVRTAERIERHVRARRAGRGRRISVEWDKEEAFGM